MSSTPISMDTLMLSLKTLESADLFKFMKAALSEAEKKSKQSKTAATTTKKAGSMPKGAVPPQLKKPRAWVEYTLKNALENGWESFTIAQKKKTKSAAGEDLIVEEEIEMPASVLHDGSHIYEDSISEKNPNGRQIIHKEAMSLSKQRKESGHASYAEFEAQYVDESSDDDSKSEAASTTSSKKIVIKKTAAEKEAEKEAKKAEKEAEKEAKKAEKEAEKEAKKAEKEAEKEKKKAEKEAEKEKKKAEKEAEKNDATKDTKKPAEIVPAKAVKKVAPKKASE